MKGNNLNQKSGIDFSHESLSTELEQVLQELAQDSKELQDKVQYFEYKNKNGEYYVFSYNAVTGEKIQDIKQKYVNQYGGNKEGIIITDNKGNEIHNKEFTKTTKIYLKVKMDSDWRPIKFYDVSFNGDKKYIYYVETEGRTPHNIRQIYQDQIGKAIPEEDFLILDLDGKPYNDSVKFKPGDVITIKFKKSEADANVQKPIEQKFEENVKENNPKEALTENKPEQKPIVDDVEEKKESIYKNRIENQTSHITRGNKENPEISITFDDGYGENRIKHVLDTLRGSEIHATFFILGECINMYPQLWKQAIEEGHQICCHTYSHIYLDNDSDITNLRSKLNSDIDINKRENNVKKLLGNAYYEKLKTQVGETFPTKIPSAILLKTEILMWEAQVKKTLGETYLQKFKIEHPFFRFPGGCGWNIESNINVLKQLGYLSIGWSDDFFRNVNGKRTHMSAESMKNINIQNGDIPLFHFKEDDYKYLDAYLKALKTHNKESHPLTKTINP